MQYQDYTIYHQLNDKSLYIKVINNMMLTIYETNLIKNQFKYKLEIVNNIFDNCLKNKNITLKFMVLSNQLQIIVLYKTKIIDFEFEISLDEIELMNVQSLDLNKKVFELEQKIKMFEELTPIVFNYNHFNDQHNAQSIRMRPSISFYDKAMLICNQTILTRISGYINKPENKINKEDKERYDRILNYIKLGDNMISQYSHHQVIIPFGKILKVWNDNNIAPKIYTCGIHTPHLGVMFWCGSEEYKDDILDNFKLQDCIGL
jgi:hypothetical protein